ncbi:MAG: twin-arginine translocation signal domain-containing protein [Planctomycetota bacterium]
MNRRGFLRILGAGAASLAISNSQYR